MLALIIWLLGIGAIPAILNGAYYALKNEWKYAALAFAISTGCLSASTLLLTFL